MVGQQTVQADSVQLHVDSLYSLYVCWCFTPTPPNPTPRATEQQWHACVCTDMGRTDVDEISVRAVTLPLWQRPDQVCFRTTRCCQC